MTAVPIVAVPVAVAVSTAVVAAALSETAALVETVGDGPRCAQCAAVMAAEDIFCGECGFVARSILRPNTPNDTVALSTVALGAVAVGTVAVDDVAVKDVAVEDIAETRLVTRSGRGERFVLQFSTGESVTVFGNGLLGRNPTPEPGEYFTDLVTIIDPGKSVSKTHLEFGRDAGAFWVSDRFSGNGSVVREPGAEPRRCEPGKRYRIVRGTRVDIGEQFVIVS